MLVTARSGSNGPDIIQVCIKVRPAKFRRATTKAILQHHCSKYDYMADGVAWRTAGVIRLASTAAYRQACLAPSDQVSKISNNLSTEVWAALGQIAVLEVALDKAKKLRRKAWNRTDLELMAALDIEIARIPPLQQDWIARALLPLKQVEALQNACPVATWEKGTRALKDIQSTGMPASSSLLSTCSVRESEK